MNYWLIYCPENEHLCWIINCLNQQIINLLRFSLNYESVIFSFKKYLDYILSQLTHLHSHVPIQKSIQWPPPPTNQTTSPNSLLLWVCRTNPYISHSPQHSSCSSHLSLLSLITAKIVTLHCVVSPILRFSTSARANKPIPLNTVFSNTLITCYCESAWERVKMTVLCRGDVEWSYCASWTWPTA